MVRRDRDKTCASHRVRPGRITVDRVAAIGAVERDVDAAGLADPVGLHDADLFRPLVEAVESAKQIIGVFGNTECPLLQFALFDDCA